MLKNFIFSICIKQGVKNLPELLINKLKNQGLAEFVEQKDIEEDDLKQTFILKTHRKLFVIYDSRLNMLYLYEHDELHNIKVNQYTYDISFILNTLVHKLIYNEKTNNLEYHYSFGSLLATTLENLPSIANTQILEIEQNKNKKRREQKYLNYALALTTSLIVLTLLSSFFLSLWVLIPLLIISSLTGFLYYQSKQVHSQLKAIEQSKSKLNQTLELDSEKLHEKDNDNLKILRDALFSSEEIKQVQGQSEKPKKEKDLGDQANLQSPSNHSKNQCGFWNSLQRIFCNRTDSLLKSKEKTLHI